MLVGAFIMTCWAIDRHESYKIKSIKHTPIFPFIDVRPPKTIVNIKKTDKDSLWLSKLFKLNEISSAFRTFLSFYTGFINYDKIKKATNR